MIEKDFPFLEIKGKKIKIPLIQGGMGVGVSLYPLANAVAKEGGLGIVSSAALDRIVSKRTGKKYNTYEATYEEISRAKENGGFAGINIMVALVRDYNDSVKGALDANADVIISGAGLPLNLPAIQPPKDTALIPIVSSVRALELICKKWERLGYRPDAVVLEGPLAGGHLGFKMNEVFQEEFSLEKLFPPVKDFAQKNGDFPVIVAGGIYSHADILKWIRKGANGIQMGTRFLATHESDASPGYKLAVVECAESDIVVVDPLIKPPGSPCGLPFRIIKQSPMFLRSSLRKPKCNKGYVLRKDNEGHFSVCPAKKEKESCFCICNGLLSSAGCIPLENEPPIWTVGSNAGRINKILSVKELMDRLKGNIPDD